MKKLTLAAVAAALILSTATVSAQHRMPRHHYSNHNNHNVAAWVIPTLVTSLIVYGVTRPEPVVLTPAPVEPVIIVTSQDPLYRKVEVYDPACYCVKQIYVQVIKEIK